MKLALLQMTSGPDAAENLATLTSMARAAAAQGASLIVAPEAASQGFEQGRLDTQAEDLDGKFATELRKLADELGVVIVAGMFRPADTVEKDGKKINRVYNTALITGGGTHRGYDKIHTYDAFSFRESDTVKPGEELVTFTHQGTVIGVATCFDIRFPEQFKELARRGAELIVVPTSWADGPGKLAQWRLLTAARALDAGVFIAAAGQARPGGVGAAGTPSGPTGIGHSTVVGPQGDRLAELGYAEGTLLIDVPLSQVTTTRHQLPVLAISEAATMR